MKKQNQKGFTLAELLIVVAIIAVLVAISIPVFNTQLEKSREQTDIANIRAAKAIAVVSALDWKIEINGKLESLASANSYYYDAARGVFVKSNISVGYGKGTQADGGGQTVPMYTTSTTANQKSYKASSDVRDQVLKCKFEKAKSTYYMEWVAKKAGS